LVVFAALVLLEVAVRGVESRLSVDIQHLDEIPSILTDLEDDGLAGGAQTMLFLGNSLTRRGVDLELIESSFQSSGISNVRAAAIYPDDTTVLDWLHLYESKVAEENVVPDVVVVSFGDLHLEDRPLTRAQTHRLGRHFVSWSSLRSLFSHDATTLADRSEVLLSKVSALFANRERIALRILSFLPYYQQSARTVNDLNVSANASVDSAHVPTFERLRRLIATVEASGAELILVAMPILEGFEVHPSIYALAESHGVDLVDARFVPGLMDEHFEDTLHLDPATGGQIYSRHLASRLAALLAAP
jgi:hypothetical protein